MNEYYSEIVHPVLDYGLRLKSRVETGEPIDLDYEQARLKDLLLSDEESLAIPEYGADQQIGVPAAGSKPADHQPRADRQRILSNFLGVRYALTCWLDEIFTATEQLERVWTENKLEGQLYGTNDRAWKFWEQAKLAQSRPGNGGLEAFYLCVCLGFRGKWRDQPEHIRSWCNQAKLRLGNVPELSFSLASETRPMDTARPLNGRKMLRRMVVTSWLGLLVIIPVLSFALTQRLAG
jgi:type VI secretion system protein ImpK